MDIQGKNYVKFCESAINRLDPRDKEIVSKFYRQKCAEDLSPGRLLKILSTMKAWRRFLPAKTYDQITKDDIIEAVTQLHGSEYEENTKVDFKKILKMFFKFLKGTRYPPPEVDWIVCEIKKNKEKPQSDIILPEDVTALLEASDNLMEKALISSLFDTGCRIGELLPITISQIVNEKNGLRINITGKTGARNPLVIESAPYLRAWLDKHPNRHDQKAYVFIGRKGKFVAYQKVRKLLIRLFEKAGIRKKCNPHHFRGSYATYKAKQGWSLPQLCVYYGWVQGSKEAQTYLKLSAHDTDEAVLKLSGKIEKIICKDCGSSLDLDSRFSEMKKELELLKKKVRIHEKVIERVANLGGSHD